MTKDAIELLRFRVNCGTSLRIRPFAFSTQAFVARNQRQPRHASQKRGCGRQRNATLIRGMEMGKEKQGARMYRRSQNLVGILRFLIPSFGSVLSLRNNPAPQVVNQKPSSTAPPSQLHPMRCSLRGDVGQNRLSSVATDTEDEKTLDRERNLVRGSVNSLSWAAALLLNVVESLSRRDAEVSAKCASGKQKTLPQHSRGVLGGPC